MTETTNYKLKKPSSEDFYNIDDHNQNMDAIDGELKRIEDEAQNNREEHLNAPNPHKITAATIGLGKVNNTSDMEKPVSTAQATAIANAKNEANTTAMNYVTNSRSGHMAENIHVSADERTKWNSASDGVIQLNGKVAQQEFELIKTQEFAFIDVFITEDASYSYIDITGFDISKYKEMVFEFTGNIITEDDESYTMYNTRYSQVDFSVIGVEEDGEERNMLIETVGKLSVNHKTYMGTQTTDFDSTIKVKTNINHQGYSTATGHSYYGIVMQQINGRWGENYLSTQNHKFRLRHTVGGANNNGEAVTNVHGIVNIYGKKGF